MNKKAKIAMVLAHLTDDVILKAGDKIMVKGSLNTTKLYGMLSGKNRERITTNEEMCSLAGKVVTIAGMHSSAEFYSYSILEDRERWFWTDEMFDFRHWRKKDERKTS